MTDQPDLKARVEDDPGAVAASLLTMEAVYGSDMASWCSARLKTAAALLSRITDLEAERDDVLKFAGCDSLSQLASAYSTAQANWDLTLDRAQAAESRLAMADRLAEAGKPFAEALAAHDADVVSWPKGAMVPGPLATVGLPIKLGDFHALHSALTAYEENTSSKDLTTGEDDA